MSRSVLRTFLVCIGTGLILPGLFRVPLHAQVTGDRPLTVVAIGDVGDAGSDWRANAFYITDMFTGRHDAGKPDMLVFLGDNFIPTGLNVPVGDVESTVEGLLRPLAEVLGGIPASRVHAIPGEHDYYARFMSEKSSFFGLIKTGEGPTGVSDKGNSREAAIDAWTYHRGLPGEAIAPIEPGSTDSVQFIFFDSAILLRTEPSRWHEALSALKRILVNSGERTGIGWRVLCVHHPWCSVGPHGGYSTWNDETESVDYLTNCDKDSNGAGFVRNWIDPEDLCADRYRGYIDSVKAVINAAGVRIQLLLAAHDRSLQLLSARDPGCDACPPVHIISGAGSLPDRVKLPSPPLDFTSAGRTAQDEGISPPGFVQLQFHAERVRVVFYNGRNGEQIDMGDGQKVFWVGKSGAISGSDAVR